MRETLPCRVIVHCAGTHSYAVNLDWKYSLPLTTVPQRQLIIEAACKDDLTEISVMADLPEWFYIRPDSGMFKVGDVLPKHHVDLIQSTDKDADQEQIQAFEDLLLSQLGRRVPRLQLKNIKTHVTFYDWTIADSYLILDGTDVRGCYAAIGTSGVWFKGAPVIGALMAERIERDRQGNPSTFIPLPRSGNELDLSVFSAKRQP